MKIIFNKRKSYLSYLLITLLKQKIDNLNLLILKEKIKVILKFKFFKILKNLKTYLNLTKWLYNYILIYIQVVKPL